MNPDCCFGLEYTGGSAENWAWRASTKAGRLQPCGGCGEIKRDQGSFLTYLALPFPGPDVVYGTKTADLHEPSWSHEHI